MNWAKGVAATGTLAMAAALIYGFSAGDFLLDGGALLRNPWGLVSIVDLYTGFALFSLWIIYREKCALESLVWVIAVLTLGFFTASIYVWRALHTSRGNWKPFWLGKHYDE